MFPVSRLLSALVVSLAIFAVGCTHPIEISGGGKGDIVSNSGARNCSNEQQSCNIIVGNAYKETYTAVAREGSVFSRWIGCDYEGLESLIYSIGDKCFIDIPDSVVKQSFGNTMLATIASFNETPPANIYILTIEGDYIVPANISKLYTADLRTGAVIDIGRVAYNGYGISSLVHIKGRLFGTFIAGDGLSEVPVQLAEIILEEGVVSDVIRIGQMPIHTHTGVRLATFNEKLYAIAWEGGPFYEISINDGFGSQQSYFNASTGVIGGIVFDENGLLYTENAHGDIYSVDLLDLSIGVLPLVFSVDKGLGPSSFVKTPFGRFIGGSFAEHSTTDYPVGRLNLVDFDENLGFKGPLLSIPNTENIFGMVYVPSPDDPEFYTSSDLSFPLEIYSPADWEFTSGSPDHVGRLMHALDLNLKEFNSGGYTTASDIEEFGKPVRPVAPGVIIDISDAYGRVTVKHSIQLHLEDGETVLDTWYSDYTHMNAHLAEGEGEGTVVTPEDIIGTVGKQGTQFIHFHFAITKAFGSKSGASDAVDIPNQLGDFITPVQWWSNWCGESVQVPALADHWWELGEVPCP